MKLYDGAGVNARKKSTNFPKTATISFKILSFSRKTTDFSSSIYTCAIVRLLHNTSPHFQRYNTHVCRAESIFTRSHTLTTRVFSLLVIHRCTNHYAAAGELGIRKWYKRK